MASPRHTSMASLAEPRYCRRGEHCKLYDPASGRAQKLGTYHHSDLCRRCEESGTSSIDIPEEHRELFRTARALLEEGIEGEDKLVPTLVFSAISHLVPELRHMSTLPAGTQVGSEAWANRKDDFYSTFDTLEAWGVAEGVLIVRRVPWDLLYYSDEEGTTVCITIDVYDKSATADELSEAYRRLLSRLELRYVSPGDEMADWGGSAWAAYSSYVRILLRPVEEPQLHGEFGNPAAGGRKEQTPFPNPQEAKFRVQMLLDSGRVPSLRKKLGQAFTPYNLIPAVVAWYVGNRGAAAEDGTLQREVRLLVNEHLLKPCADRIPPRDRDNLWKDVRKVGEHILRVEEEIKGRFPSLSTYL